MQPLIQTANHVLDHIHIYLDALEDNEYAKVLPLLSDTSIGAHTRHVLDGFLCLARQTECGVINYELRKRDKTTEESTQKAIKAIEIVKSFLYSIRNTEQFEFTVTYADNKLTTKTTLERELIHNIEHTIHHLAIIKIALKHYFPFISLPEEFGIAPSTIAHWKRQKVLN